MGWRLVNRRIGTALSLHPISSIATGEVLGSLLESVGYGPDLVVLFVSESHREHLDEIVGATRTILGPHCLVGTTARAVLGGGYETDGEPAISAWAGRVGAVTTTSWSGDESLPHLDCPTLVFGTDAGRLTQWLQSRPPSYRRVGGGVAASGARNDVTLMVDDQLVADGFVAVRFDELALECVVSQGTQPFGPAFTITKSERNVVYELAFQPALDRLNQVVYGFEDDRSRLHGGIHLGVRRDPGDGVGFSTGLVREVLGADRANGALSVDVGLEVGEIVQFHIRDRRSALYDLDHMMSENKTLSEGRPLAGTLLFTSRHRGRSLFGDGSCDASVVSERTQAPLAGVFCEEEYGPTEARSSVHKRCCTIVFVAADQS